jgi:hypothetical protein
MVLAVFLAVFSYARIDFSQGLGMPKLEPRGPQKWQSKTTLFITDERFPWGSSVAEYLPPDPQRPVYAQPTVQVGDPTRFANLAVLYAKLANGDEVRRLMLEDGPVRGSYQAAAVPGVRYSMAAVLPLILFLGVAESPEAAVETADRSAQAFRDFLTREQDKANIPAQTRVVVRVSKKAQGAQLVDSPSKTLPMVVFMTIATLTFGLAFALENLRPRPRPVTVPEAAPADLRRLA